LEMSERSECNFLDHLRSLRTYQSRFGLAFQQAAQLSGTRTVLDKFENSVIEIQKDDLSEFIEKLHLTLAERA